MVRLFHAYFPTRILLLCLAELGLISAGLVAGIVIRTGWADADLALVYEGGYMKVALITGIVFVWMYYFDLYDSDLIGNRREIFTRMTQVVGTTCVSPHRQCYIPFCWRLVSDAPKWRNGRRARFRT